jgi:predicted permease
MIHGFWNDVRQAARASVREPGFTLIAVLMLTLGIGVNTAIFSVVNGVLLKPLSYADPARLVTIREVIPAIAHIYPSVPVNARHFVEWRKQCTSFEGLAVVNPTTATLTGSGEPERLDAVSVSPNLFRILGVRPAIGRDFLDDEEQEGRDRVVVITDGLWTRRFNRNLSMVGQSITLDGRAHTVVGVLPPDFRFPNRNTFATGKTVAPHTELFRPATFSRDDLAELLGNHSYGVIARLKKDAHRERAVAELEAVQAQMEKMAGEKLNMRTLLIPLLDTMVGDSRHGLLLLLAAAGAVLLIVCVNLANLLLARSEKHGREAAIRTALGAGRTRLIRQSLAEALLISAGGAVLGVAVAASAVSLLIRRVPIDIPRLEEVGIDARVLLFAFGVTLATCLLFGLLPAWRASGSDPQQALKGGGRTAADSRAGVRLRCALVTAEVGLSAMLLIVAGLLVNSFFRLMTIEKGFHAGTVLAVDLAIPSSKYGSEAQRGELYRRVVESLSSQPGIVAAAMVNTLPLQGESGVEWAWVPGDNRPIFERALVNVRYTTPDYLRTMGIPLRAGRTFTESDRHRKVAVISERLAAQLWPARDPIGRTFARAENDLYEVVGVAGDVRTEAHTTPVPMVYRPYWESPPPSAVLVARAAGEARSIASAMRAAIHGIDPDLPVSRMRTMSEVLEDSVAQRRFQMTIVTVFAVTALLLASLGIYGVISYSVARRTGEIGLRAALGATIANLYALIMWQGMAPVGVGLVLGIGAAFAAGRVISGLLFNVTERDPLTIAAVAVLLLSVAGAACFIPARRAAKVDPITALHYE